MNEPVILNLTSDIALPQIVVLPAQVRRITGVDRRFTIARRDQEVPRAVRDWLHGDPRYAGWFAPDAPEPVVVEAQAAVETPVATDDQPPVKKADGETWSEKLVVPQLREYADRHGVELTADDKKADIVARLREARGAFEVKDGDGGEAEKPA